MLYDLQRAIDDSLLTNEVVVLRGREMIDAESFANDDPVFQ